MKGFLLSQHGHESFCRICGIILENTNQDKRYCNEPPCSRERRRRRMEREKNIRRAHAVVFVARPWTSCCIDNLWCDYTKGVSVEDISADIKRPVSEILEMLEAIKDTGFDYLYMQYMEKEGKLRGDI